VLDRGDSAAATHAALDWPTGQDATRGRQVEYSIGEEPPTVRMERQVGLYDGAAAGGHAHRRREVLDP
jgi:hypothetical protein